MQFAELLRKHLDGMVVLSDGQVQLLAEHHDVLVKWNKTLNLTSIRNVEDAVVRHYCESLFFAARLPFNAKTTVDFGSGAGFPGIPMAILLPEMAVTLSESHQRKAVFLREASRSLENVVISARRGESLPSGFDLLVSRAVNLADVLSVGGAVAKRVGMMVGRADADELLRHKGVKWESPVILPWGDERVCLYGCFT